MGRSYVKLYFLWKRQRKKLWNIGSVSKYGDFLFWKINLYVQHGVGDGFGDKAIWILLNKSPKDMPFKFIIQYKYY